MRTLVCTDDLDYRDTEQEARLLVLAQLGDQKALTSLMKMHARLITYVISRLPPSSVPFEYLESGAHEGFLRAIHKYRAHKGKFSTYAVDWIDCYASRARRRELRYLRQHRQPTLQANDADGQEIPVIDTNDAPVDAGVTQQEQQARLKPLLKCLSSYERQLVEEFYGLHGPARSFLELARHHNTSTDTIKGIVGKALRRLRTIAKTTPSPLPP